MTTRRVLFAAAPLALPWTVLLIAVEGSFGIEFVFAWGLLSTDPLQSVSVVAYLFEHTTGLPEYLLAWPSSALLYALGFASVVAGVVDREDRRLTAGLFLLAGLSHLRFAAGIGARGDLVAVPVGTALLWLLAWRNRPQSLFR